MKPIAEVRQLNGYDTNSVSDEYGLVCPEESLTVQADKDDADINVIVRRYHITGAMPENVRIPSLEDYSSEDVFDFQSAMNVVVAAREAFMELPADLRVKFRNDPQEYLEFCTETDKDGKLANLAKMRELGIAKPEVLPDAPPEPMLVRVLKEDGDDSGSGRFAGPDSAPRGKGKTSG